MGERVRTRAWSGGMVVGLALLLGVVRWFFPERPMDYTGPRALLDAGFALGLLGLILLLAGGLGCQVQRWLGLKDLSRLERTAFSLPIGLAILAYGVLALGLVGLLQPGAILLWLIVAAVWTWREWTKIVSRCFEHLVRQIQVMVELRTGEKASLVLGGLILICILPHTLTPPCDYDGLMYHLPGPQSFLQAGRILLLPDIWQANGPFTVEMLFTVGLAFGSDTFAKLVHLTYAVCLVLATIGFGRRYLGRTEGWIALVLLLGIPTLPMWIPQAYIDMAWALYEFLGMYALFLWRENKQRHWLLLAGLMMGWAIGSKYLALGGLAVLGVWLLWKSRKAGGKEIFLRGLFFGGTAILIGAPWYVKNWLYSGNPVYPFIFGGTEWDVGRLDLLMAYLRSFGTGQRFLDYVLLPWNLYAQNARFGTSGINIEIPGWLFPLALLYPLARRRGDLDDMAGVTILRFVVWATGSQQTRFLLPLFPALSLIAASVLTYVVGRPRIRRWRAKYLAMLLLGIPVLITLLSQVVMLYQFAPLGVVLGRETKNAFLSRMTPNYSALQFVQHHLPPDARVLMMWNGRGYYCDARCLPDADQSNWTRLALLVPDPSAMAVRLGAMGVTHLLLDVRDVGSLLNHDPTGQHRRAIDFFWHEFRPSCAREIYQSREVFLFEIACR